MPTVAATHTTTAPFELIGPLQARVMQRLWTSGPQTVQEVCDALNAEPGAKRLAYTTYLTVMRNLARRKMASQTAIRRAHLFTPLVSATDYRARLMAWVRRCFFNDDAAEMGAAAFKATAL